MSENTPSQAEGDRDTSGEEARGREYAEPPRTTPSQAEGDDDGDGDEDPTE
ncbi:hypothetical protein ACIRF8_14430 [Streptomyces sp. NPDC102406]|uniref:hypothetical protein n=1 Tax=Streptomyces sp. NPDC102406 TaxID=3366171 RepID=UPI003820297E